MNETAWSIEADPERVLLGVYLTDPALAKLSPLEAQHFRHERHGALYDLIRQDEWQEGARSASVLEMALWLGDRPKLASGLGGIAYVMQHADYCVTTKNAEHYERLVIERYRRRKLATVAMAMHDQQKQGLDADNVAQEARRELDALDESAASVVMGPGEGARAVLYRAQAQYAGRAVSYILTGWREWDEKFGGLPSEGVILFLARSGMGKTSLINSLAVSMASTGLRVHVHGTETSAEKRNEAIMYGMASVDMRYCMQLGTTKAIRGLQPHKMEDYEGMHGRIASAAHDRAELPLWVSGSNLSVERVAQEIRRQHHHGLRVAFIDYVQDFPPSRIKGLKGDKLSQSPHASGVLKNLSAELRIPIVVAAQVSNEKDGLPRAGQVVPQMWDAQWSSTLHQDAEEVYAINRGDYWWQRSGSKRDIDGNPEHDESRWGPIGVMEIHARKRRVGELDKIEMDWSGPLRWVGPRWPLNAPPARQQRAFPKPAPSWNENEHEWRT